MTSIETLLLALMLTLIMPFSVAISRHPDDLSKSWTFSREIYLVELRYSETIIFGIHSNFTNDSEIYDIVKLYYDFLKLCSSILVFSEFKLYIILINLVNVNLLINL